MAIEIRVGVTVLIAGLKSRPELNDTKGVVRSQRGERWVVELAADNSSLALKPTNLVLLLDDDDDDDDDDDNEGGGQNQMPMVVVVGVAMAVAASGFCPLFASNGYRCANTPIA